MPLNLESDLHPTLVSRRITLEVREEVSDIVPRVSVQTSPQSLLIEIMRNQTNRTPENEEAVKDTHLPVMLAGHWTSYWSPINYPHVVFSFLSRKSTTVSNQVNEADGNTSINIENQVILFASGDGLDSKGIVQKLVRWKSLKDKFLDKLNTQIRVISGLDLVADTRNCEGISLMPRKVIGNSILSLFCFLMVSTKSLGLRPLSKAPVNSTAAPSRAPPNLSPIVNKPETRAEIKSFPALVVIMVFIAPETAGP